MLLYHCTLPGRCGGWIRRCRPPSHSRNPFCLLCARAFAVAFFLCVSKAFDRSHLDVSRSEAREKRKADEAREKEQKKKEKEEKLKKRLSGRRASVV